MSYSDQKFYSQYERAVAPVSFGTATASATDGHALTAVALMPKFIKRTKLNAVRLRCTVIPNAASTALKASLLVGTNTIGTAVLTTATLGQSIDLTITAAAALTTWAADTQPTWSVSGTATASAAVAGTWEPIFLIQELPS